MLNAGSNTGEFRTGVINDNAHTPTTSTNVVTIEQVEIAIVEMTYPSSEPGLTSAFSMAFNALGAFKLVKFPVTNAR